MHFPSQQLGPAAGTTRKTLAAPLVPNGIPAMTTSKSLGVLTKPFISATLHAALTTSLSNVAVGLRPSELS